MKRLLSLLVVVLGFIGFLEARTAQTVSSAVEAAQGIKSVTGVSGTAGAIKGAAQVVEEEAQQDEQVVLPTDPSTGEYWSETEGWKIDPNRGR